MANYQARCALACVDRYGRSRAADRYVHIQGKTLYVCEACATALGRDNGIPDERPRRAPRVLRGQLGLDLAPETHSGHQAGT